MEHDKRKFRIDAKAAEAASWGSMRLLSTEKGMQASRTFSIAVIPFKSYSDTDDSSLDVIMQSQNAKIVSSTVEIVHTPNGPRRRG